MGSKIADIMLSRFCEMPNLHFVTPSIVNLVPEAEAKPDGTAGAEETIVV